MEGVYECCDKGVCEKGELGSLLPWPLPQGKRLQGTRHKSLRETDKSFSKGLLGKLLYLIKKKLNFLTIFYSQVKEVSFSKDAIFWGKVKFTCQLNI